MTICTKNPIQLLINCKNIIANILSDNKVGFNEKLMSGKYVRYSLEGINGSIAEEKNSYFVLPLLPSRTGDYYWVAITIGFLFDKGDYCFQEESLFFFEGMRLNTNKKPIIRAEWSERKSDCRHAQPHWHVYPSYISKIITPLFDEVVQPIDFGQTLSDEEIKDKSQEWEEGKRFHYAMASRWHSEDERAHQEEMTKEKLEKWTKGCLVYVKDQLSYIQA